MEIRIGERFGKLTVVSKDENKDKGGCIKWICKCDCGNIVSVRSGYLRNGTTKSCGCIRRKVKDISGEKFGRLTVLDFHLNILGKIVMLLTGIANVIAEKRLWCHKGICIVER